MNDVLIKATQVSCKVGSRYLIKQINWTVHKGEHWVIFGMNGSGKTTLLSLIAGYRKHTYGTLQVFGQSYSAENIFKIRKKIGWVSSSFFDKYMSHESALNIVLSGLTGALGLQSHISNVQVKIAKDLLKYLNLAGREDYPFDLLSKGERQNVLIARALLPQPKIMLLDEPSTGLDILAKESMMSMVRELARHTGITILYVTHYAEKFSLYLSIVCY